jgi:DNA-binding HxlR family transcriptional regulator
VELVGKRWTGAIIAVLMEEGPARFSEVGAAVPDLSDRLLSERMKELEARGLVERRVHEGRTRYRLTPMGEELRPAVGALRAWAQRGL